MGPILFSLGALVATPATIEAVESAAEDLSDYLDRHRVGDFGSEINGDEHDLSANNYAIENSGRVMSSYVLSSGVKIWIFTYVNLGQDHSGPSTWMMLPNEY